MIRGRSKQTPENTIRGGVEGAWGCEPAEGGHGTRLALRR